METNALPWLESITRVAVAYAWPVVVLVCALLFRREVSVLLARIQKLKHKDTEVDFSKELEAAQRVAEVASIPAPQADNKAVSQLPKSPLEVINSVAEVSPAGAVMEAWKLIEGASREAATRLGIKVTVGYPGPNEVAESMFRKSLLSKPQLELLEQLRILRNQAAHHRDVSISKADAVNYGAMAIGFVALFEGLGRSPR